MVGWQAESFCKVSPDKDVKRIVFFIESFSGGGAERVLYTVLKYIDRKRFNITVLVMSDTGVQKEAFHKLGVRIINILDWKLPVFNKIKYKLLHNFLPTWVAAQWILKGVKADTYVAFVEGYCTKLFSRLPKTTNKIAWVHIDLANFPWTIEKKLYKNTVEEKMTYSTFNQVVGVSDEVTNVMKVNYGISKSRTIYNPIDEASIKKLAADNCKINVDQAKFNLISVGRLTRQKGYDKLIDLMPSIVNQNPSVRLYIVGEGEDRIRLDSQIKSLGIESFVTLTGFLQNPYSLMARMDAFVCSSRAEGFSLVIAEAMIIGLPIISMECAGPCEILGNGKYGILCKSYDELSKYIAKIAKDKMLLDLLKIRSLRRTKIFDTVKTIKLIEDIL